MRTFPFSFNIRFHRKCTFPFSSYKPVSTEPMFIILYSIFVFFFKSRKSIGFNVNQLKKYTEINYLTSVCIIILILIFGFTIIFINKKCINNIALYCYVILRFKLFINITFIQLSPSYYDLNHYE